MTSIDWSRWRKCPVCDAPTGEPCLALLAKHPGGRTVATSSPRPHGGRQPRTGGA